MTVEDTKDELTFEEQLSISEILEGFRNNPSNSNKYRYNLFAYINNLFADRERLARANEVSMALSQERKTWQPVGGISTKQWIDIGYLEKRYKTLTQEENKQP